ncbi:YeeE/YedE family protein [Candidatus Raskinella chloraquaticus]
MSLVDRVVLNNTSPAPRSDINRLVLVASVGALVAVALNAVTVDGGSWRLAALTLVGALLGIVLYRASFGFSNAFRLLLENRDGTGLAAHAIMLALTSVFFFPLIGIGSFLGQPIGGPATPIGITHIFGAILFGIGMQIGGGCASGTLFALGGGNGKLLSTLAGFVIGSTIVATHIGFWWGLPALPATTMMGVFGWQAGLAVQLVLLAAMFVFARRRARLSELDLTARLSWQTLLIGPWPLIWGGIGLALLNVATLIIGGFPWSETSAFMLWGGKIVQAVGIDPSHWDYWVLTGQADQLTASIFADKASVMDLAIILGAAFAAASAGRFDARRGGSNLAWIGALIGGILMGYGARLSNGCNIGAYFSAVAAGDLAGFVWVPAGILGSAIGIRLRPFFDLVEKRQDDAPVC